MSWFGKGDEFIDYTKVKHLLPKEKKEEKTEVIDLTKVNQTSQQSVSPFGMMENLAAQPVIAVESKEERRKKFFEQFDDMKSRLEFNDAKVVSMEERLRRIEEKLSDMERNLR